MADNKTGFAQFMDKLAEGLSKSKENSKNNAQNDDLINVLPKPDTQEIGDGVIVWRWTLLNGSAVVESVLAFKENNQQNLNKDEYVVSVKLPGSENGTYSFYDDTSKAVGQAILSAWNWKTIWKLHAGDFLLESLSDEQPVCSPEPPVVYVPETIDVEPEAVETTPSFDNG